MSVHFLHASLTYCVVSVVEWSVCLAMVQGDVGSNPNSITVFPHKASCLPSSNRYLAVKSPPCECDNLWSSKGNLGADATYAGLHEVLSLECSGP